MMHRLPQSVRHHVLLYSDPRELFVSHRVSKDWKADLDNKQLWKQLKLVHHRNGPEVDDPKAFMLEVLRGYSPQRETLDYFEFILTIDKEKEMVERLVWRGKNMPKTKFLSSFYSKEWKFLDIDLEKLQCKVYVTFKKPGLRSQYRCCRCSDCDGYETDVYFHFDVGDYDLQVRFGTEHPHAVDNAHIDLFMIDGEYNTVDIRKDPEFQELLIGALKLVT